MAEKGKAKEIARKPAQNLDRETQKSQGLAVLFVALCAVIFGGLGAAGMAVLIPQPQAEDYAIEAVGPLVPTQEFKTTVHNPAGVLSAEDEARLVSDAQRLSLPAVVKELHYIVFNEADEKVNDTVEKYLRDEHPELIGDDSFSDGVLIVGVSLDPRQVFVYAGEDVNAVLDLRKESNVERILDSIKPGVLAGNIPAGLFHGADSATDLEELSQARLESAQDDATFGILGGAAGAGGLGAAGAIALTIRRSRRKRSIAQARQDIELVNNEYTRLAHELQEIDIRAHSLISPLVDETLREDWAKVRDRFLNLHQSVDSFGHLTSASSDKEFLEHAEAITQAAELTNQVHYAEDNINTLFQLEHGDPTVRQREVEALRSDIVEAQTGVKNTTSGLYAELQSLRERCEALEPEDADFLEHFMRIQRDYQAALNTLRTEHYSDIDLDQASKLDAPRIYEAAYRPGYGVNNFVPYWVMASWYSSNLETQQSAAMNGGVDTSFSSGFSGAGGSSSF